MTPEALDAQFLNALGNLYIVEQYLYCKGDTANADMLQYTRKAFVDLHADWAKRLKKSNDDVDTKSDSSTPTHEINIPIKLDLTALEEAQRQADKLKETFKDVQTILGAGSVSFVMNPSESDSDPFYNLKQAILDANKNGQIHFSLDFNP